mmetsp:Transcript_78261/g.162544  ORF Transcript_78261/g.162544 Transcript_78261/m.162544 type:complete len:418 (-) Transcript_78261:182-1435(-)
MLEDHECASKVSQIWITVGLTVAWWGCAVMVTVLMKAALSSQNTADHLDVVSFPFPLTLTFLANIWTAAAIDVITILRDMWIKQAEARTLLNIEAQGTPSTSTSQVFTPRSEVASLPSSKSKKKGLCPRQDWQALCLMGVMQGLGLGAKNEALLLLSVSTRTMIMATNVLVVMSIAICSGAEIFSWTKMVAGSLVAIGGALQGFAHFEEMNSDDDRPSGYVLAATALILDATRWVLLQRLFARKEAEKAALEFMPPSMGSPPSHPHTQALLGEERRWEAMSFRSRAKSSDHSAISKLHMVSLVMWSASPVILVLSLIFEPGAVLLALKHMPDLMKLIGSLAIGVMGINVCEFGVVQWTSAVTFTILSNLHSIPMVVSGIICFGEQVVALEVLGFTVCIMGSLLYSQAKNREAARSYH